LSIKRYIRLAIHQPSANILRQIVHILAIVATVCNILPQIVENSKDLLLLLLKLRQNFIWTTDEGPDETLNQFTVRGNCLPIH
jgi:hypothetical protein